MQMYENKGQNQVTINNNKSKKYTKVFVGFAVEKNAVQTVHIN